MSSGLHWGSVSVSVLQGGADAMKMINPKGEEIYYNVVTKHDKVRYVVQAASGQTIRGRDRQKTKSRTFPQEHQVEAWLRRNGYTAS